MLACWRIESSNRTKENRDVATGANDVIVVGGGIIGCLTAYLLAREGLKVTVLEADAVGSHASGFAFGGLSPLEGAGIPDPLLGFSVWCMERNCSTRRESTPSSMSATG